MVLGLGVFYLWPVVRTAYFSFTKWGAFGGSTWIGFGNYRNLFHDHEVLQSLRNTAVYTLIVLLAVPIAMIVAAMLNQRGLRGVSAYRVFYFLPVVTIPAAVAIVWRLLYNGDYGPINYVLSLVGIKGPYWLSSPTFALIAISIVGIWMVLGQQIIIFLAGLQAIPQDLHEAASIDGAGPVRRFVSVTMPLLTPSIFFVTVLSVIGTFQMFDLMYVMIDPNNPAIAQTRTIVYLFYERGFIENDRGYAAAIAFLLFGIIMLLTLVQFRLQKRWVHYV
jgi:multiple sugar transport system permease protein